MEEVASLTGAGDQCGEERPESSGGEVGEGDGGEGVGEVVSQACPEGRQLLHLSYYSGLHLNITTQLQGICIPALWSDLHLDIAAHVL